MSLMTKTRSEWKETSTAKVCRFGLRKLLERNLMIRFGFGNLRRWRFRTLLSFILFGEFL